MKRFIQITLISAGLMATAFSVAAAQVADTIFFGGPIVTVNQKNEEVQALAVQNGKIVAVGKKDVVLKEWRANTTQLIEDRKSVV